MVITFTTGQGGLERPFDKKLTELMKHGYFREYSTRGILTATKKYNKGVLE
jgi:hypothetical protein